jgi:hypothetical protein
LKDYMEIRTTLAHVLIQYDFLIGGAFGHSIPLPKL